MSKPLFDESVTTEKEYGIIIGKLMDSSIIARPIWVTVSNFTGKHSNNQRKAFHALMDELEVEARGIGKGEFYTAKEWKRHIIKGLFGMVEHKNLDGTVSLEPRSSSDLKMSEYAELITFTLDFAAHHFDGEITLQVKNKD